MLMTHSPRADIPAAGANNTVSSAPFLLLNFNMTGGVSIAGGRENPSGKFKIGTSENKGWQDHKLRD
jgi:hypothetical protein